MYIENFRIQSETDSPGTLMTFDIFDDVGRR